MPPARAPVRARFRPVRSPGWVTARSDPIARQSHVSDDDRELRVWLARELREAGYAVVIQDELVNTGESTLVKLSEAINRESDLVLHLTGPKVGKVPSADVLESMFKSCGKVKFREWFPKLFETGTEKRVT